VLVCTYAAHAQPIADPNDTYPLSLLRFPDPATGGSTCHTFGDSTKVTGCCGSPGALGCAGPKLLVPIPGGSCTTDPSGNNTRIDGYDHLPYCNLPQASCDPFVNQSIHGTSSTSMSGPQKTTFYFTSDIHFYRGGDYPLEGQVNHVHYLNDLFRQHPLWTFQH